MSKSYKDSRNKWTYIWIAIKHFTTPTRVYRLAHGEEDCHKKDRPIMHDLKEYDIIHHSRHSHG